MEACGTHSSRIERVPEVATSARPVVILAGRPAAYWTSYARTGRVEAFFLINLAIQNHVRLGGVSREGAHAQYYDPVLMQSR